MRISKKNIVSSEELEWINQISSKIQESGFKISHIQKTKEGVSVHLHPLEFKRSNDSVPES